MLNYKRCFRDIERVWRPIFDVVCRGWSLCWRHQWRHDIFPGTCRVSWAWRRRRPDTTKDRNGERTDSCCTSYLSQFDRETDAERILDGTREISLGLGIRYSQMRIVLFYRTITETFDSTNTTRGQRNLAKAASNIIEYLYIRRFVCLFVCLSAHKSATGRVIASKFSG